MAYKVLFPSASTQRKFEKSLEDVFPYSCRSDILDKIQKLSIDPRPNGNPKIRPPVYIYQFIAQYRLRIGEYRVLYDVDDSRKKVWILALRRRRENTYL